MVDFFQTDSYFKMSGQNKCGNYVLVENRFWHVDFCNECEDCLNRDRFQVGDNSSSTEQDMSFFEGVDFNLSQEEPDNNVEFNNVFDELEISVQQEEWIDIDDNINFFQELISDENLFSHYFFGIQE